VTDQDIDLACAVGATLEMITAPTNGSERQSFYELSLFYIGRLSARDDHTNWGTIVAKSMVGRKGQHSSLALMKKCLQIFGDKVYVDPPPQSN
jgi:hypothetical protein